MVYSLSSTGVKGDTIEQIMKNCMSDIIKIGFYPIRITCDQSTAN